MQDIYKVSLSGELVGFFFATTWGDAAKAGASHHKKETGEAIYWGHFMSKWVNPKHYEQEGVPESMYKEEEGVA